MYGDASASTGSTVILNKLFFDVFDDLLDLLTNFNWLFLAGALQLILDIIG